MPYQSGHQQDRGRKRRDRALVEVCARHQPVTKHRKFCTITILFLFEVRIKQHKKRAIYQRVENITRRLRPKFHKSPTKILSTRILLSYNENVFYSGKLDTEFLSRFQVETGGIHA